MNKLLDSSWVPSSTKVLYWLAASVLTVACFAVTTYAGWQNARITKVEVQSVNNAEQIAVANTKLDILLEAWGLHYYGPRPTPVVLPQSH